MICVMYKLIKCDGGAFLCQEEHGLYALMCELTQRGFDMYVLKLLKVFEQIAKGKSTSTPRNHQEYTVI